MLRPHALDHLGSWLIRHLSLPWLSIRELVNGPAAPVLAADGAASGFAKVSASRLQVGRGLTAAIPMEYHSCSCKPITAAIPMENRY